VCDSFPPKRSSVSIHMDDLSKFFQEKGHQVSVFTPDETLTELSFLDASANVEVLRCRIPRIGESPMIKRLLIELAYPYYFYRALKNSSVDVENFDGIIWYSPSIFFGLFIYYLKYKSKCKAYLILRDVFPKWALDLKIITKLTYWTLNIFALFQYRIADCIGVNSPSSKVLLEKYGVASDKCEVLWTWLKPNFRSRVRRLVQENDVINFIYAGNMGVAQDIFLFANLARNLKSESKIKFLFYGRGSEKQKFENFVRDANLFNVQVNDEISPEELSRLFGYCSIGMVALDIRHTTSNIPGKFLSYMEAGLPVLAKVNSGNDLIDLIEKYDVGTVVTTDSIHDLENAALELCRKIKADESISERCLKLAREVFCLEKATQQIIEKFSK
jgi:glycosyltransferase involved in cell wall biosynthesis